MQDVVKFGAFHKTYRICEARRDVGSLVISQVLLKGLSKGALIHAPF